MVGSSPHVRRGRASDARLDRDGRGRITQSGTNRVRRQGRKGYEELRGQRLLRVTAGLTLSVLHTIIPYIPFSVAHETIATYMHVRFTTLLLPILILALGAPPASAQLENDPSSPLGGKTVYPRIGGEGGFDLTNVDGHYAVGCGTFEGGSGLNVLLGGTYEYPVGDHVRVEGLLGFRTRNMSGSYRTTEPSIVQTADAFVEVDVDYDNIGSLNISYLFLQPAVTWYPYRGFYVGAGVNLGLALGSSMGYQRDIVSRVVTLEDGSPIEIFYPAGDSPNPGSRRFPDEEPEELTRVLIEPVIMTGLELRVGRDFFMGPRFSYAFVNAPAIKNPELTFSSFTATLAFRTHLR